jgi:hypothetical protein
MEEKAIDSGAETEDPQTGDPQDGNIYRLLMDVIARHQDDIEAQQTSLKKIAGAMYEPSLPRRIFRVLFPSVESTRRVR